MRRRVQLDLPLTRPDIQGVNLNELYHDGLRLNPSAAHAGALASVRLRDDLLAEVIAVRWSRRNGL